MKKVELEVLGISFSRSNVSAYSMILSEVNGNRKLPVIIGEAEAFSISISLEKKAVQRPLVYDLFTAMQKRNLVNIKEVLISDCIEGVFYSKIILTNPETKKDIFIDSRTSDAIAIAMRVKTPIFINEEVLNFSGIILKDYGEKQLAKDLPSTTTKQENKSIPIEKLSDNQLKEKLEDAISNENYELASEIKKILDQRNK